ncbi:prolipoprotein diacylglyceryl transferase [Sphingosinicellaceae bacterium]|nr:prolipoprotein diacylglyceryl transferase [Sphingosinicellaceae bacterium]
MPGPIQIALDFTTLGLRPELFSIPAFTVAGTEIGPLALRWYSLAYIGGILLGWFYLKRLLRTPQTSTTTTTPPMTQVQADDFITWATLGIILGGRIGYVLFYNFQHFAQQPLDIIRLWDGGMSFHGGAIGMIVAVAWFARRNRLDALRVGDYVACVVPIGQCFGRLANFVNGELFGRITGSSWGIIFPGGGPLPRYPSQLFEAFGEGVVLFLLLAYLFWRTDARRQPGLLSGVFIGGFGLVRFIIEFFREPDVQVGYLAFHLTMGQLLCLPMILIGIVMIATSGGRAARRAATAA